MPPPKRKKLFFHIGSHKTATTFLQNTLAHNKKVLDGLDILYPVSGRIYDAHFKLAWEISNRKSLDIPLEGLSEWQNLLAEIDAAPHDKIVISSEVFSFNFDPKKLFMLRDLYDVKIVYYLRSPDSFLESFYNQFVKDFDTRETRSLETYMAEEDMLFLDPMHSLRPWMETFGKESIILRIFDKTRMKNGIMSDFMSAIGCNFTPEFSPADITILQKKSLPPDVLEYLRFSNPWLTERGDHHAFVVRLAQLSQAKEDELQQTRSGILSLKARQALRRRFQPSNRRAAELFLGSSEPPFPPETAPHPPKDFSSRLAEATPEVIGKIAALVRNIN